MVYLLWFVQENADAEDMELLLGAYSSEAAAKAAINGCKASPDLPRFQRAFKLRPTS